MSNFDAADLTIGDVAERTGIPASTLRMWEARYGFPAPRRSGGTHRRYSDEDCRALREIKRARAQGLSMRSAVEAGISVVRGAQDSLFNGLRLRHPELPVLVLPEPFMLALSNAMEETAVEYPGGVLVGAFQRTNAYRAAEDRWRELIATALAVIAFADFAQPERDGAEWRIPTRGNTALADEWAVVCDMPGWWGCLVGRELRVGRHRANALRNFEAMWSLDPGVVRDTSRIGARIATTAAPGLEDTVAHRLRGQPGVEPTTLGEASQFTNRVLQHLLGAARAAAARAG